MGGWTVCGFAAAHPDRTKALILCDTTAGVETTATTSSHVDLRKRSQGNLKQILTNAYAKSFPEREPALCFLYQQISALNTHIASNLVPTLFGLRHNVKPIVDHKIPTLLIVGEEDVLAPPAVMKSMTEQLPHARFVTVPQAGHSAYFECPNEFNQIVRDFIREVG